MELKQIKDLMAAMKSGGIKKLSIKEKDGFALELERQETGGGSAPVVYQTIKEVESHHRPHPIHAPASKAHEAAPSHEKPNGKYVTSPMVGTFYATPSPEDPVYVKVGDRVDENTVVCIIEAMKVMNEVKAGISGVIAEICVENAHPVEFGTKIFRIT